MTSSPQFNRPLRTGVIPSPDGTIWNYEIGITGDSRLLWVLHAPDKTHRAQVASASATVGDVLHDMQVLVSRRSTN